MTRKSAIFYYAGIDIGSTTVKAVIINEGGGLVFSRYCRHQGKTMETTRSIFREALRELGDVELDLALTGSAGMGVAEAFKVPFVQEVVASAHYIGTFFPGVKTFIEIGGEDSKIIFFDDNGRPNIRMNSNCAGGTGAFIDQMAVLLNVDVSDLNSLAEKSTQFFPIASRCGVFAKTDIQALLSRHASHEDIAASVFHAVAMQVVSLSSGRDMERKILVGGGPLTFIPRLRKAFADLLEIEHPDDLVLPDRSELIPAMGAAMIRNGEPFRARIGSLLSQSEIESAGSTEGQTIRLQPLFADKAEFELWQKRHEQARIPRVDPLYVGEKELFLGIDSGSTTTKIVLIDAEGRLAFGHYGANNGDPILAVKKGLAEIRETFAAASLQPRIMRSAATGYGESLIKAAFGLHDGVVETMAHCRAAQQFDPDVSFILDIGGQDMKAISIVDRVVVDIHINEACSSGCGSFIETFANSLGYCSYATALLVVSPAKAWRWNLVILETRSIRRSLSVLLLGSLFLVFLDIIIDPVALQGKRWFLGQIYGYNEPGCHFGVPLSNYFGWWVVSMLMVLTLQLIDALSGRGREKPAGVADVPFRSLFAPILFLSVIVFNITVTLLIGERLMAVTGIFIFTLPIAIVSVGIIRRTNRYGREELAGHLRDYPWSLAGKG